jgi:2-keto-4-pentenoate hydratase/2-oxohepta-3-ene-1,7-dioic acid hydratase in catechol pathway
VELVNFLRFSHNGQEKTGILENGEVKEISGNFFDSFELTGNRYNLNEVNLLAPCTPSKVVAVGLNYTDHIKEFEGCDIPENPILFIKLPHTVIGPEDTILIPENATRVDYEAELAVVIKKICKNVEAEEVNDYLLGATCLNDVTERHVQKADGQWTRAKNFNTFCPIGPFIVNDMDYNALDIRLYLNGELKQHSNTKNLLWNVQELVSFISKIMPLYPGDVVSTGTPSGVGPMNDGDVVEIVIEGIGTLKNKVRRI